MRPDQIRDAAWALDALSKLTKVLYEPIAHGGRVNAGEVTVTCHLTEGGDPMSAETAQKLVEWVASDQMQNDLRALADALERDHDCSPDCEWPDCPGYPVLYLSEPDGHPLALSKHDDREPSDG